MKAVRLRAGERGRTAMRGTLCLGTWNVEGAVQFNPEREAIVQYKRARCSCERGDGDEPKA